jgi:hypothetical protein
MRSGCIATLVISVSLLMAGQDQNPRPKFSDYPVKAIYRGKPAPPILSKDQRYFRTMIRLGAKSKVEFSGHYTLPRWGCGTGCNFFTVVDSITGKVYDAPFGISELPGKWLDEHEGEPPDRMEYRVNSRLLRLNGCANERDCGFYDFVMVDGKGLMLVRKELLPNKYQY